MRKKQIVALEGDGIGIEVVQAVCSLLKSSGFDLDITIAPSGEAAFKTQGSVLPQETVDLCEAADAILFGAVSPISDPIIHYLRWGLGNYFNVRPAKHYPGTNSPLKDPEGIDLVILRENSEGLYTYAEGDLALLRERLPEYRTKLHKSIADFGEGKWGLRIITEKGIQRFAKLACEYTLDRKKKGHPGNLTVVTKSNMFPEACGLFEKGMQEEVRKYPGITYKRYFVDDMARRIVRFPKDFDVIATSNLFGDILSDEAAEIVGGLGLAGSAVLGGRVPYFESVHGSAPDIAGKNIANPTATILAAKYMLDYLGMTQEANILEEALAKVYKEGKNLTADQGGKTSTTGFVEAVLNKMR
jgi:isocitrate/isopropylmalate dehydrogenase